MNLGTWEVVGTAYESYFLSCMVLGLVLPLADLVQQIVTVIALGSLSGLTAGKVLGAMFMYFMLFGLCFGATLILAFPGFVVIRGLLYWARIGSALGFGMAGALGALVTLIFWFSVHFRRVVVPADAKGLVGIAVFLTVGALTGLVCWWVETRSLRDVQRGLPRITPPKAEPQP